MVRISVFYILALLILLQRKWQVKKVEGTIKDTDTTDYWELVDKDLQKNPYESKEWHHRRRRDCKTSRKVSRLL